MKKRLLVTLGLAGVILLAEGFLFPASALAQPPCDNFTCWYLGGGWWLCYCA